MKRRALAWMAGLLAVVLLTACASQAGAVTPPPPPVQSTAAPAADLSTPSAGQLPATPLGGYPAPGSSTQPAGYPAPGELSAGGPELVFGDAGIAPAQLTVKVGDTVTFRIQGAQKHQPYSIDPSGLFDPLVPLSDGQHFSLKMDKAGTVKVGCRAHPNESATIEVTP